MAKKKVTHQPNDNEQQNPSRDNQNQEKEEISTQEKPWKRQPSVEDPSEKLQNLKSLNSMLIKETFQRRQQIESLEHAKMAIEAELTLSGTEMKELASELTRESERNLGLELEKILFYVIMETQMKEMEVGAASLVKERDSEIGFLKKEVCELRSSLGSERDRLSGVCQERDLAKSDLGCQVEEANRLKERVIDLERKERAYEEEMGKLKEECICLMEEKLDLEETVKDAISEKKFLTKAFEATVKEAECLKYEIEGVVSEKKEIEREMVEQSTKIQELEAEGKKLKELVLSLRKEEEMLLVKILEMEMSCTEAIERASERAGEVDALMQETREKDKTVECLMEEKEIVSRKYEMKTAELEGSQRRMESLLEENEAFKRIIYEDEKEIQADKQRIEDLSRERDAIERIKVDLESANVELQAEVSKQKDQVSRLQGSCQNQEHKNKELTLKIGQLKSALDQVTLDRDDALKELGKEKNNCLNLMSEVSELKRRIEETSKQFMETRNREETLLKGKMEIVSNVESLRNDKDKLQNELLESKKTVTDLRAKVESTSINAEQAFALLKRTALLLSDSKSTDDKDMREEKLGDEIEPYASELEEIKNAFRNKETMVDEMKRQVEFMQNSMARVQRKKSFWTLISSLTTIFAAASFAYAARGH